MRVGVLGLMAMLLFGSYAATSAFAEIASGGPYFYHRAIGGEGKGVKISEKSPEIVQGKGGEQKLHNNAGTIEILSKEVKTSGIIYNNENQGQAKIEETYAEPKLVKPNDPECKVKVGTNNTVNVFGDLEWKWNGTKAQQKERPQIAKQKLDWVFFSVQPTYTKAQLEGFELPEATGEFTKIHFEGECGVLKGTSPKVTGSDAVASLNPTGLEEWSQKETLDSVGPKELQHFCFFWTWHEFLRCLGFKTGLVFNNEASEYKGEFEEKTPNQEEALFEE
jgi:hypothetical protein